MRTTDALKIGMELGRIRGALDAWEESKHPRADNGQFTSGAGGSTSSKMATEVKLPEGKKNWNNWEHRKEAAEFAQKHKMALYQAQEIMTAAGNGQKKTAMEKFKKYAGKSEWTDQDRKDIKSWIREEEKHTRPRTVEEQKTMVKGAVGTDPSLYKKIMKNWECSQSLKDEVMDVLKTGKHTTAESMWDYYKNQDTLVRNYVIRAISEAYDRRK